MSNPPDQSPESLLAKMKDAGDHELARLTKMQALRGAGDDPFKIGYDRTHLIGDVVDSHPDLEPGTETDDVVGIAGRVMIIRRQGKLAFANIVDASGQIQLFAQADVLGDSFEPFTDLDIGDWIGASGRVMTTKRGELSVKVESFQVLTKGLRSLPEKWHGLKDVEIRYRQRYLDLISNPEARRVLTARSHMVAAIRSWLADRAFMEVETPMLQPIAGGALAKPFVTFHNVLDMNLFLRIAPELYLKRLIVGGMEKVFEVNRNFRNEGVSMQHNPEFTMLELYEAFSDYDGMATILEGLVRETARTVNDSTTFTFKGNAIDVGSPFRRARLIDLVREAGADPDADLTKECDRLGVPYDPKWSWGKLLVEIYEKKVEHTLIQPTFVMDYPREVSPLARTHRDDDRFTEHLDLIICGIEVGVAYSELTDPLEQRARFEGQAAERDKGDEEAHVVDEDFIKALEYGMPPTGGLGLGIDRLAMILTDSQSLREVILFPALRPE